MFLRILLNYITGYVNIQIEGFYIERFINICISKNILLWNMDRKMSSILNTNIAINDFKKIKSIAKKTRCKVKIKKKKGIPFIFERYKKRKIFAILLICMCSLLLFTSNFIWNIEISETGSIPKEEIMSIIEENGFKIGTFKSNVDTKKIVNEIRLSRDDVAWVGIEIKGTNAIIQIVEADKKPEIIDRNDFCNIVANKDGIITKINVQNGTAKVKVGDIVNKGDVLVEGKIQGKYTDAIFVHSIADIEAKVWYSKKLEVPYYQEVEERTGNEETKYEIKTNNFKINLYKTLSKFQNYDTIRESKKVNLFSNFYIPIEIVKITNYEKEKHEVIYGKSDLQIKTVSQIDEELKNSLPKETNILNRYVNINEQNEYLIVEVVYEVLEKLGDKEKMIF